MEKKVGNLEEVRRQIIDTTLIIAAGVGSLTYLISLTRWINTGFQPSFAVEFLVLAALLFIAIRRSVISSAIKTYALISLILVFSFSDAIYYGLFSAARIYLILIPFFAIFYLSALQTILIYIVALAGFLLIGILHHKGILCLSPSYQPDLYILRIYPWVINAIHISIVATIVFLVTRKFLNAYNHFIIQLQESNLAIRESERNYREVFNSTGEAIFIHEASSGKILDVNEAMLKMYRFKNKEQVFQCSVTDLTSQDPEYSEQLVREKMQQAIHAGPQLFEWKARRADGEVFWTEVSLQKSDIGGLGRILAVVRDINPRKKSEEAIRESQELSRRIIELGPYPMVLNSMDNRYLVVNDAFCRDTGFSKSEVLNKTAEEIGLELDKKSSELIRELIAHNGKAENIEVSLKIKNGSTIEVLYSSLVFNLNGEPVVLSSGVNITERKAIEKELEKHRNHLQELVQERTEELAATNEELTAVNEELTSANEDLLDQKEELRNTLEKLQRAQEQLIQSEKMASLGILASGIAHEINNPLNFINAGISGVESYLVEKLPANKEEYLPFFHGIYEGVSRAAAIIRSLGHYSRRGDLPATPCSIHDIIDNCLVILHTEIKAEVRIQKNYQADIPKILGNEGKLHQAFMNILANALHAIGGKGSIEISTKTDKKKLIILVTDNGPGISKANLPHVFDLFFTTKDPGKGSGLGLSITYDIIKEQKGEIRIESEEGTGTRVIVILPIQ